jgi:hypothetical protein
MSAPNTMTPQTSNAIPRIGDRLIPENRFPRRGTFAMIGKQLVIVVSLGKRGSALMLDPTPEDPKREVQKDFLDTSAPFAEVHLVETRDGHKNFGHFRAAPDDFGLNAEGEEPTAPFDVTDKGEVFNVPFDRIARAPWSIVGPIVDSRNGPEEMPSVLWAKRAGYLLTDEQEAEIPALIEAEERAKADAQFLAAHPEAVELEKEIERQRVEFVESMGKLRQDLADKLLAERQAAT